MFLGGSGIILVVLRRGSVGFLFCGAIGVDLQAGNTVGALVGFSASLQPNQNAYTKIEQGKVAECRLRISTCLVQIGWGVFIPLTFVS